MSSYSGPVALAYKDKAQEVDSSSQDNKDGALLVRGQYATAYPEKDLVKKTRINYMNSKLRCSIPQLSK